MCLFTSILHSVCIPEIRNDLIPRSWRSHSGFVEDLLRPCSGFCWKLFSDYNPQWSLRGFSFVRAWPQRWFHAWLVFFMDGFIVCAFICSWGFINFVSSSCVNFYLQRSEKGALKFQNDLAELLVNVPTALILKKKKKYNGLFWVSFLIIVRLNLYKIMSKLFSSLSCKPHSITAVMTALEKVDNWIWMQWYNNDQETFGHK